MPEPTAFIRARFGSIASVIASIIGTLLIVCYFADDIMYPIPYLIGGDLLILLAILSAYSVSNRLMELEVKDEFTRRGIDT